MKFSVRAFVLLFILICVYMTILFLHCFGQKVKDKGNANYSHSKLIQPNLEENIRKQNYLYSKSDVKHISNTCSSQYEYRTILFFNEPDFMKGRTRKDFIYKDCECKNCIISRNQSKFSVADAVIFHIGIRKESIGKYPPVDNKNRNPNQAWIFTSNEPPEHYYNTDYKSQFWHDTMNWSCLYRLDSDIQNPYGNLIRMDEIQSLNYDSIYEKKTKNALWIVSHCHVASARRKYILEMISHGFDVDILGGCSQDGIKIGGEKLQNIAHSYKYFLAFENSLCTDYITEKYFNHYNFSWILVVRGGANYKELLPEGTYVNTAEFRNISVLVKYLLELGNDKIRYINYLKGKDKYTSIRWPGNRLCEICRRINSLDHFRKSYVNIDTYLNEGQCKRPKDLETQFF